MGWMAFVFSLACLLQMAAIPLIARARNKKRFCLSLAFAEPILFIMAVTLALTLPREMRMMGFISAVFIAGAFVHLSRPVTDDWFALTIPTAIRGRYLGRRLQVMSIAIIAATLIAGFLGQSTGMTNTSGLGLILIAGALCGMLSVLALRGVPMPALAANSRPRLSGLRPRISHASLPRHHGGQYPLQYPLLLRGSLLPGIQPGSRGHAGKHDRGDALWILPSQNPGASLAGRTVDRWGPQRTLYVAGLVYAAFFATFLFCGPGLYWAGHDSVGRRRARGRPFGLATQTALYASVPDSPSRPAYFAVSNIVSLVLFGIAGLAAVPALEAIRG